MSDETITEPPSLDDIVRAEQVRLLYADGTTYFSTLAASLGLAAILIWEKTLSPGVAIVWLSFLGCHTAARVWLRAVYLRVKPPVGEWRKWGYRATLGCI